MIPIIVVGAKSDEVSKERMDEYTEQFKSMKESLPNWKNIVDHVFTSSKLNEGIDQLFLICENLVKLLYQISWIPGLIRKYSFDEWE